VFVFVCACACCVIVCACGVRTLRHLPLLTMSVVSGCQAWLPCSRATSLPVDIMLYPLVVTECEYGRMMHDALLCTVSVPLVVMVVVVAQAKTATLFSYIDTNEDGSVDKEELMQFFSMETGLSLTQAGYVALRCVVLVACVRGRWMDD
jgi:hypothetical protein